MAFVGHGGMGSIYRAADALSGQSVALKLLHAESSEALLRFHREASVLAGLHHPGIVSYVAHGTAEDGRPFLAMQWLEGEDLAQRIARQPLSAEESLALLRHAAQALAAAHQRGIIHRDLKPSNLFLRDRRPEDVVLVDFGLARHVLPSTAMTGSQVVLGTPGYMAPEQISSQGPLTPAADIFSLGCVLYECLTGKPPFAAPHFVAALAKILFTEPEPLRSLRPELPVALEQLLSRMLARQPERRLADAPSLVAALESIRAVRLEEPQATAPAPGPAPRGVIGGEQQLVSVLLAAPRGTPAPSAGQGDTWQSLRETLRHLLSPHGAQVELLADGALVVTLVATHGSATDPAALAARCALLLQERSPDAAVVLTTGRGRLDPHRPVGEAMDRAGELMHEWQHLPADTSSRVLLDEVTAGLLGPGFQLTRAHSDLFLLQGEQLGADETRPLLGKPTPCVGREQELALLELAFNTCVQESAAQAVLVKAPAGMGKSRLRHEFLRRLKRQEQPVLVLMGRGDPMSAGSADGLLGQALRRLCGITGVEPLDVRRERLSQGLARHLSASQAQEVTSFLGELCGIPFPDTHHPRLSTARGNPQLLSTHVGRALVAFLRAECAHQPVLLILEDLHWGERLTLRLLDEALRELAEQPFMVLALARPEVEHLLSEPWTQRMQEIPLRGLNRKAEARLVREVLGANVPDTAVDRLVEQAAGSPLFLEELIRAEAEGRGESAPQTVLAMIQARIGGLEPQARQVLLAASFSSRSFCAGGLMPLLGDEFSRPELEHWMQRLVEQEWVERQAVSRFPHESEYRFRHALVRDAAYGLVPDSNKPTGHRLMGEWLERSGDGDPRILAEHYRLGQQSERAIHFYVLAAEQHFDRHDMQGMERSMEAALALGPGEEARMRLRVLRATAAFWMDDFVTLGELGRAVLPSLKAGSSRWNKLVGGLSLGCALGGQKEYLLPLCRQLLDAEPEPEARSSYFLALCFMGCMTAYVGAIRESAACFERLERTGQDVLARDGIVRGWQGISYSFRDLCLTDGPWRALDWARQAEQVLEEVGSDRDGVAALTWASQALLALGQPEEALACVRRSVAMAERVAQPFPVTHARQTLALILAARTEPSYQQEARELVREWVETQTPNRVHLGTAYLVLARVAATQGAVDEAVSQAQKACEVLEPFAPFVGMARWLLAALLLAQGRVAEARQGVELALRDVAATGDEGAAKVGLLQVLADACFSQGDIAAGEDALRSALQCLRSRAEAIPEVAVRERFLRHVPENARVLDLARQRWGDEELP